MKRLISTVLLILLLSAFTAASAEVPQISDDLFMSAKQALFYLASGEYERLVTLLPFSDVSPSAVEWQSFAEGNFFTLSPQVQTNYAVAYWTGFGWWIAVPLYAPTDPSVETLVLASADGYTFAGYRYSTWGEIEMEYEMASYVTWNKEYVDSIPMIVVD